MNRSNELLLLLQEPASSSESVAVCVLEHPTFVYCARFHPSAAPNTVLATGSYDKVVRIWTRSEGAGDEAVKFDVAQVFLLAIITLFSRGE